MAVHNTQQSAIQPPRKFLSHAHHFPPVANCHQDDLLTRGVGSRARELEFIKQSAHFWDTERANSAGTLEEFEIPLPPRGAVGLVASGSYPGEVFRIQPGRYTRRYHCCSAFLADRAVPPGFSLCVHVCGARL